MRHAFRRVTALACFGLAAPLTAQRPDTVVALPELSVSAPRDPTAQGLAGWSLTLLDGEAARRGRITPGFDELLAFLPGVLARDRPDHSLDTRIVIRGAGARANFGVRGVRVLVDGVPATLPDGQTPLTTLDLERVARVEVARGPIAALHGNGSHGVVSLATPARRGRGISIAAAGTVESAAEGLLRRGSTSLGFGGARLGGLVGAARMVSPGLREHAFAEQTRVHGSAEWQPTDRLALTVRGAWAVDDSVESPGALTLAEFANDPTGAAPNSVLRAAGKALSQRQLAATLTHRGNRLRAEATSWILGRTLENPLAAPAPPPTVATQGTWVGIDRVVVGTRTTVHAPLAAGTALTTGVDVQRMRDDRVNRRHDRGVPVGEPFLDQRETVTEFGAFAQLAAALHADWLLRGGVRHDAVRFAVDDHRDAASSGARTMRAWSASGGVSWHRAGWELWLGAGSAFETPTTTELANRADGSTGFNATLDPSRTLSVEAGVRRVEPRWRLEVVTFAASTDDAITAVAESGGRSYFANRGTTTTRGLEGLAGATLGGTVAATATVTWLRARFGDEATSADGTPLAGRPLPGVPRLVGRLGLAWRTGEWLVTLDQAWSAAIVADDAGTTTVPGWGAGLTNLLLSRQRLLPGVTVTAAARNLFDRRHAVGAVVNGAAGRVVEPGTGRVITLSVAVAPES